MASSALAGAGCTRHEPSTPAKSPPPQTVLPQTPSFKQRMDAEAKWLSQYPQLATRQNDTLVLRYHGAEIARYVNDPKGCDPYSISKVLRLADEATGALEPVAEITCHFGPLDNRYLVLPSSDKYVIKDDAAASHDGRIIAMTDSSLGLANGQFALMTWPALTPVASFKAGCHNMAWRDESRLTALCWHNNGPTPQDPNDAHDVWFTADIGRDTAGHWQMQGKAFIDPVTLKSVATNGQPMPRLTGFVPPPNRP